MSGGATGGFAGWALAVLAAMIGVSPDGVWGALAGAFCGSVIFIGGATEYPIWQRRKYAMVSFIMGLIGAVPMAFLLAWPVRRIVDGFTCPAGVGAAVVSVISVWVLVWIQKKSKYPPALIRLWKGDRK